MHYKVGRGYTHDGAPEYISWIVDSEVYAAVACESSPNGHIEIDIPVAKDVGKVYGQGPSV